MRFKFAIDILKGVQYLHGFQPPIAHLDLKSPNVLIYSLDKDATINCKLADFGTAQFVRVPVESKMVENPVWTAPEVLEGVPYDESADTYAVGVILWELVTRMNYFGELGSFLRAIHDKVIEGNRPPIPAFVLPSYASIIQECWAQSPESRPKDWNRIISLIEHMRVQVGEAEVHISTMYPKLTPTPSSTSPRTTPSPKSPTAASPTSSTPKLLGAVRSHSEKREEREEGKKSVNSERVSKVSVKRTQRVPARTASELSMGKWEVTKVVEQRNMIREKSEEFRKDSEKTGSDIPTRRTTMEQTLHFGLSRPKLDGPGSALKKLTKLPFPPEQHEVNMAELPEQEQYRQFVLGLMRSDSSREDPMSSPTVIDSITQIDSPYNTSTSKMASKQKLAKRPRFRHPKISDLVELMVESHTNNSTFNIAVEKQDTERRKSIFNVISSATLRWIYDNSLENMSVRYSKRDGTQKVCAASAWFPPGVSAARMDFQKHLMDAIKHVRKVSSKGALRTKTLFQDIFELTNTMVTSNCWELLFISIIPSCIEFRDVWEDILDKVLSQADKSQQSVLCFTSDQKQMEMLSSFHFSKVKECITCKTATIWALMRPPTPKS
uniref:Protein kinase domain-containing protein n=1 Tax=Arcella intermedia TaxID=1963864 RepID=A0A6B2KYM1_9EUKA